MRVLLSAVTQKRNSKKILRKFGSIDDHYANVGCNNFDITVTNQNV